MSSLFYCVRDYFTLNLFSLNMLKKKKPMQILPLKFLLVSFSVLSGIASSVSTIHFRNLL